MNHKCGIAGISFFETEEKDSLQNASFALYKMLLQLQHRGQLSAGITVYKKNEAFLLQTHKRLGLVNNAFHAESKNRFTSIIDEFSSPKGIGHVRYATCGADDIEYAQPFEHFHGQKNRWFSIAFNGNIANYEQLKKELEKQNYNLVRKTDTEVILLLLAKQLKRNNNIVEAFRCLSNQLDGAYNIAFINAEGTIAVCRDPLGLKPLCYAVNEKGIAFASENVALQSIGFKETIDLPAGHLLIINGNGKNGNGNGTKQVSISAFEKENGNGTNGKENGTEINAKENSFETLNDSALQNSSCACVEKVNLFEAVEKKVLGKKVLSNENGSNFGSSAEFGTGASALELNANNSNLTSSHFSVPKFEIKKFSESKNIAHCFFEWIYFAHAASKLDGRLVYSVRRNLGKELAKMETQKIDGTCVVVAVPDSSTPCGQGFAEALNIPMQEGLIRNRYLGRTFIEGRNRAEKVRDKFAIIKEVFEGKKVFLVEDSIVRGTTLKNMVEFIKKNGSPKEIHVRVSCPPIKFPCFYGIDMSTKKELIAHQKTLEEIRKDLDVDSLVYQTEKGLLNALEIPKENLCMACLNGLYPTKAGKDNEKLDTKNCKN